MATRSSYVIAIVTLSVTVVIVGVRSDSYVLTDDTLGITVAYVAVRRNSCCLTVVTVRVASVGVSVLGFSYIIAIGIIAGRIACVRVNVRSIVGRIVVFIVVSYEVTSVAVTVGIAGVAERMILSASLV